MTPHSFELAGLVDLAARVTAGDAPAGESLASALYGPVRRFLTARLRSYPEDVLADVTQEAMIAVLAYLPGCRASTDGQLLRWVMLASWHAALRYLRSPAAGPLDGCHAAADEQTLAPAALELWREAVLYHDWADDEGAAGDGCRDVSLGRPMQVLASLAAVAYTDLPAGSVNVVRARVIDGASYAEIADAYGTTSAGAKRRVQRALASLRRLIIKRVANLPKPSRAVAQEALARVGASEGRSTATARTDRSRS